MIESSVPNIVSILDVSELTAHYKPLGGKVTLSDKGYIVRLPQQKRVHFYNYDVERARGLKPYVFESEGHYDEFSPLWDGPPATAEVIAEYKKAHAQQRAERYGK